MKYYSDLSESISLNLKGDTVNHTINLAYSMQQILLAFTSLLPQLLPDLILALFPPFSLNLSRKLESTSKR